MYWFVDPPYLRYAAAVAVVLVALWFDLRPEPTEPRWMAREPIPAGTHLTVDLFEEIDLPPGLLPRIEPDGVAAMPIAEGEPLLPGHVLAVHAPDGWWVVSLEIPSHLPTGADLRVVLLSDDPTVSPEPVPGIVVGPAMDDGFSFGDPVGSVAIPGDRVEAVAAASARGRVVVVADR